MMACVKKRLIVLLCFGLALGLSGCATCCQEGSSKPVSTGDMLSASIGCANCSKSDSPLIIEKQMPKSMVVGKPYTYTIKVMNNSGCALDDVTVSEKVPNQYAIGSAMPQATRSTGNIAEWELGYLAPKETKTIQLTGISSAAGSAIACTKASYKPMLCLGPEAIAPSLKVTLDAPQQALMCDTIPLKVTVSNTGTGYAENVTVRQSLPEGLTTQDGRNAFSTRIDNLAGGASKTYTVQLKAQRPGNFDNSATAESTNGLTATAGTVTTAVKQPVLNVAVSAPEKTFFGKNAAYQVRVQNTGDTPSEDTVVTASVPEGMKFVSADNGGKLKSGKVVWNIGALNAGQEAALSAVFKGVTGGTGQSIATAEGACTATASAAANLAVQGIPAVLLEMVDTEDPIEVGSEEKFYVTVTNQGTAVDTNIKMKMSFEDNFDYVSSQGPTRGTAVDTKHVEFAPLQSLAPGQKATWEIVAKALTAGDHRAEVEITTDAIERPVHKTESTRVY